MYEFRTFSFFFKYFVCVCVNFFKRSMYLFQLFLNLILCSLKKYYYSHEVVDLKSFKNFD